MKIKNQDTTYTIKEASDLLPYLLKNIPSKGRNATKAILTRGQVTVDGQVVTQHNYKLQPGQKVSIVSNQVALKKTALVGITILHEDEDIIVINKDDGILSVAAKDPTARTAYRQVTEYVKEDNRNNRIFIVHRLDRDTSGVMLFAKTEDVKNNLQENWKTIVKERAYVALVEGALKETEGTFSSWLTENKATKVYSDNFDNGGKHAVTHYKKVGGNDHYSLLEVQLETGRKNQIRVHMQELGHPVAGDRKYGATSNPLKRLGLHAKTLALLHPRTGKLEHYSVEAPEIFFKQIK